jgi:NADPH-dependent 2,4-dienoyl-CoA reductase/sulfur reductase-like enzyme
MAGLAPAGAQGLDWFAGMAAAGAAELRAAAGGRATLEDYLTSTEFDPEVFTAADHAAPAGTWSWLAAVAGRATEGDSTSRSGDGLAPGARQLSDIGATGGSTGIPRLQQA